MNTGEVRKLDSLTIKNGLYWRLRLVMEINERSHAVFFTASLLRVSFGRTPRSCTHWKVKEFAIVSVDICWPQTLTVMGIAGDDYCTKDWSTVAGRTTRISKFIFSCGWVKRHTILKDSFVSQQASVRYSSFVRLDSSKVDFPKLFGYGTFLRS
jgi:hypothetical protein